MGPPGSWTVIVLAITMCSPEGWNKVNATKQYMENLKVGNTIIKEGLSKQAAGLLFGSSIDCGGWGVVSSRAGGSTH
jgi:hypothetical protein